MFPLIYSQPCNCLQLSGWQSGLRRQRVDVPAASEIERSDHEFERGFETHIRPFFSLFKKKIFQLK